MLLWLTDYLTNYWGPFRVFHYLTFRAILTCMTAFGASLILGPYLIGLLKRLKLREVVRDDGPQRHLDKAGTPTMGGAILVISIVLTTLLWSNLYNHYIWVMIGILLGFGIIGFIDDYQKLTKQKGLSAKVKYSAQSLLAILIMTYLYSSAVTSHETALLIPFLKDVSIPLGVLFPVLGYFVLVGTSNAVNLTDGLDGLAIMPTVMIAGAFGVFSYAIGNQVFATYLSMPFIPGTGEVVIVCAAFVGAGLGFLWFNTYPAQVFMGDVGALSLGAGLGGIAIILRQELVLFIMGGVFVLETVSVMIQVGYFKLTQKRVFLMAPLHHHFELKGWAEPKIIVRFWILTFMLVLVGLSTLKLR